MYVWTYVWRSANINAHSQSLFVMSMKRSIITTCISYRTLKKQNKTTKNYIIKIERKVEEDRKVGKSIKDFESKYTVNV